MWTYNRAKVYVGDYSYTKTHTYPETAPCGTYESCEPASCSYITVKGNTIARQLRPIKVRGGADFIFRGDINYHTLETFEISPLTNMAIIRIFNGKGSHLVKLIKHQQGSRNTIFKTRL